MRNTIFICSIIFLASCGSNKNTQDNSISKEEVKKQIEHVNQYLVRSESQEIDAYVKRHFKDVKTTATGLRYFIYQIGDGIKAETGMLATIAYKSYLINGAPCYSSEETGPKTFEIGKGNIESGLEEGILLLKVGDKAKFILPSHLAWGLPGDQNKIPKRATLIYEIELLKLEQKP